jgi:hypothetical protein
MASDATVFLRTSLESESCVTTRAVAWRLVAEVIERAHVFTGQRRK